MSTRRSGNNSEGVFSIIKEYTVDFFGILLLDLLFLMGMFPTVIIPSVVLFLMADLDFSNYFKTSELALLVSKTLKSWNIKFSVESTVPLDMHAILQPALTYHGKILTNFQLIILFVTTGVAYIAGQCLFRQDPKLPDAKSFIYIHVDKEGVVIRVRYLILRLSHSVVALRYFIFSSVRYVVLSHKRLYGIFSRNKLRLR